MSVFVGVPVKNCAAWLPRFLQQVDGLSDVSRVVFIYGQSRDPTLDVITQWMVNTDHEVEIYREPSNLSVLTSAQIGVIYRDFQQLVREGNETHALMLDSDIMKMPRNLIQRLKDYDKDIIAPYVYILYHGPGDCFYDTYCFRIGGYRFHPFHPPMNNNELFKIDSVGTCVLSKRKVFLEVPYQNNWPHMSFCNDARVQGYEVWADPKTRIEHLDLMRFRLENYPIFLPESPSNMVPIIKDDGTIISESAFSEDYTKTYIWGQC